MAKKHTLDTLTDDVERLKKTTRRDIKVVADAIKDIRPKVQEMHDYIVEQRGFERGRANIQKDGTININKDVWGLLVKLVLFAMAIAGITKLQ